MGKKIAVFTTAWDEEQIAGFLRGMRKKAEETGSDIYVFNNYGGFVDDEDYNDCEYVIFSLPRLEMFDGAVIYINNVDSVRILNVLVERAGSSGIPYITVEWNSDQAHYIGTDNYMAMCEMVEHLVQVHNCRIFNYVGGPSGHIENEQRKRAFTDMLRKHGIEPEAARMRDYTFTYEDGRRAYHDFAALGLERPDAVVCANDSMAAGYADEAEKYGLSIPADLIITGFDNSADAKNHVPVIASVGRSKSGLGYTSLSQLLGMIEGKEYPLVVYAPHRLRPNASCGCFKSEKEVTRQQKERADIIRKNKNARWDRNFTQRNLMVCHNLEELTSTLDKELSFYGITDFSILANENLFSGRSGSAAGMPVKKGGYTPKMQLLFEKTEGRRCEERFIDLDDIIPNGFGQDNEKSHMYMIMPLHMNNQTLGYCVMEEGIEFIKNGSVSFFTSTLSMALENIMQNIRIMELNNKLEHMYMHDAMTGLYNRFALKTLGETLLKENVRENKNTLFLFADMDGLKKFNDTYGHEMGDAAIKELADIMKRVRPDDSYFCIRYGGDEYLMMGTCPDRAAADSVKTSIEKEIQEYNDKKVLPEPLSASIGYILTDPRETDMDIDHYIGKADEMMYLIKKERKGARK